MLPPTTFCEWLARRLGLDHVTDADRVVPLVAASPGGLTRRQLGHVCRLAPAALDDLLAGLVAAGQLVVTADAGGPVYRASRG